MDLVAGETARPVVRLDRLPQRLETVRVEGGLAAELELRRQSGRGYVMTGEALARAPTLAFTIPLVPSVRVETSGTFNMRILMRPPLRARSGECAALLLIDGRRALMRELQLYRPDQLLGMEVYPNIKDAPAQYLTPADYESGCAVVLAWTKPG